MSKSAPGRRVDQWLFFTRLVKSRSLAGRIIEAGKVRVNKEKITKPAQLVVVGDVITAMINRNLMVVEVVDIGKRRGPSAEAVQLYNDLTPKEERKVGSQSNSRVRNSPYRPKGAGRPTKKQRRQLDLLKQRSG